MINDGDFRFDPETHSYFLGERRLIGVTEAIQAAGLTDFSCIDPAVLDRAAERGKAVHAACHYLDEGDLDWGTVSTEIEPYVRAWEKFRFDVPVEWSDVENPLYHATSGLAGTPDRISTLPGKTVTDIKTYRPNEVTGIQLAAYSFLRFGPQPAFDVPKRWGVWLKDDGKYILTEFKDRGDEAVFMAALTIAKFKESNR